MNVTKLWTVRGATLLTLSLLAAGCGGSAGSVDTAPPSPDTREAAPAASLPTGHPVVAAQSLGDMPEPAEMAGAAAMASGTVLELLTGGGYTYARVSLDDGDREIWVAGPETSLEIGQEVGIAGAMSMGAFSSPSLERTFDDLYFVGGFRTAGPEAAPPGATSGNALEVLVGGGYTYVLAKVGEDEIWLAGPETQVTVGDTVSWMGGMDMGEFTSSSLDRTFENILFVGRFWVGR